MNKVLSIVIPTKNRYSTLIPVVEAFMQWPDKDFEVVIQDNSDSNDLIYDFLLKINKDERIFYFYNPVSVTAPQNCNDAVLNSTGEYVCFIGDDDGLAHESLNLIRWMKSQNIDSAYSNFSLYAWPDIVDKNFGDTFSGALTIPKHKSLLTLTDPYSELKKLLNNGALYIPPVPRLYHGFVRRTSLNQLYQRTKTFFPGPVPDMSNAVGLVPFVKRHIFADYPYIMAGSSGHSMAGKGALKKHHGLINKEKSLPPETEENWSPLLPKYWSAQTIWAEGALKALDSVGLSHLASEFNLEKNIAACLMYVPVYYKITLSKILSLRKENKIKIHKIFWYYMLLCLTRFKSLTYSIVAIILKRRINMNLDRQCENAKIAMGILDSYAAKNPITYKLKE